MLQPDPFVVGSPSERRTSPRREGAPITVCITGPLVGTFEAAVLDRSVQGLGLSAPRPVARGAVLRIRPTNAPTSIPWIQVRVKNCRKRGQRWMLGCQFVETPSWDVLLLFG